ncbi:MAG TPA: hypothetical protein VEC57_16420 [Candidatus Limnocylindrales bacterium]|nr:hypothetical protein [Candidatus Limnocylindrales bacterium]
MKKILSVVASAALSAAVLAPASALAGDFCLQFSGGSCDLSGDLGFFRFSGKLPKKAKKSEGLHGRACGTGVVQGAAAVNAEGTVINIHATFNCDATNGNINATLNPETAATLGSVHTGDANYGSFDVGSDCVVTVVDCASEPGLVP